MLRKLWKLLTKPEPARKREQRLLARVSALKTAEQRRAGR